MLQTPIDGQKTLDLRVPFAEAATTWKLQSWMPLDSFAALIHSPNSFITGTAALPPIIVILLFNRRQRRCLLWFSPSICPMNNRVVFFFLFSFPLSCERKALALRPRVIRTWFDSRFVCLVECEYYTPSLARNAIAIDLISFLWRLIVTRFSFATRSLSRLMWVDWKTEKCLVAYIEKFTINSGIEIPQLTTSMDVWINNN